MTDQISPVVGSSSNRQPSSRADRVKEAVRLLGGNRGASQQTGVPLSTLGLYLIDGHEARVSVLERLAAAAGVNVEWLVTGRGPKLASEDWPAACPAPSNADQTQWVTVKYFDPLSKDKVDFSRIHESERPVYLSKDFLYRVLGTSQERLILTKCSGDIMSPTINSGDLMLIDTSPSHSLDGIHALLLKGYLVVKRLSVTVEGMLKVASDNERYEDEQVPIGRVRWGSSSSDDHLVVVGRVIYRFEATP